MKLESILLLATVFSSEGEVFAGPPGGLGAPMVSRIDIALQVFVLVPK